MKAVFKEETLQQQYVDNFEEDQLFHIIDNKNPWNPLLDNKSRQSAMKNTASVYGSTARMNKPKIFLS